MTDNSKNIEDDLDTLDDLSDFNFEEELDFDFEEDNEIEYDEKDSKNRKPVIKTAKKILSSAGETLKTKTFGDHGNMLLENVISNDSRSAVTDIKNMADSVRDEFLKSISPIHDELSNFLENIDERIPAKGTIRKIFNFAKDKLKKENYDSFSSSFDEVGNMLESIDSKLDAVKEKETLETEYKKSDLDYKKLSTNILTSIDSNIKIGNEYNKIFNKKSLELQYKTYLLLKDTLAVNKQQHSERLKQNEAIIKNTALPEYVKIKTSERIGQSFSNKMANTISESLFQGDSPIKLMTDNIVSNTTAKLNGFVSQLAQLNMGLSMTKGEKIDKGEIAGGALADGLMKGGYWLGGKLIGQKRMQGLENSIQSFAADPESFIKDKLESDPKGIFGKLKDKFLRNALDLATTHNRFKDIKLETTGLKDQAVFDGETHRSINMVIPKLLAKIHNELQGLRTGNFSSEKELRFDHDTLNFLTMKETKEKIDKDIQTEIYDRTIRSVNNITNVVRDKLSGVNFYGKELIMANLGNAILAYITENGRISPPDLTKKDFIQYFDPKIQPKIMASMSIFQDILKNDSDKSVVYRTFSSSLTAIKTSPALLNKYSSGMNADILLKDDYYSTDVYGGKISANGAGLAKKIYKRTGVKKHDTNIDSPHSQWANNDISISGIAEDIIEDINRIKGKNNKIKTPSFMDLDSDYRGNVKYNKNGVDFIINKDMYNNSNTINDIKFKMKYDFELESLIKEYQDSKTSSDRKAELKIILKSLLDKYDSERINKVYGNKFIRAGKRMTGNKEKINKKSDEWLKLIDEGLTIEDIFSSDDKVNNTEVLKSYGLQYAPNSFSIANDSDSRIIKDIKYIKKSKTAKPKIIQTKRKNKPRQKQLKIKQDLGDAPSNNFSSIDSPVEEKIEKDLEKAIKIKKNQEILNAVNGFNLSSYYSGSKLETVKNILNADKEEINRFLIQKYKVDGNSLSNYSYGKILYTLDKMKNIEPDKKEKIDVNGFNTEKIKEESIKPDIVTESTKEKIKEMGNEVKSTTEAMTTNILETVKSLKTKFGTEFLDNLEQGIKNKLNKDKDKNKDDEGLIDKIFNFRQKLTEFLSPKNLLLGTGKFLFNLPRNYTKFFFSDFAKKMRAKERRFIGKMFKGVFGLPFAGIKGVGKLAGMAGSGLLNLIPGYKKFFGSKFAKASRAKERKGISKILGIDKLFSLFKGDDREEAVGKDRKNGWRERLNKLEEEKQAKKNAKKADHKEADPKNSWLGKLLGPLLTMVPLALGKIVSWGSNLFKPILSLTKGLLPGIGRGLTFLGKGLLSGIGKGLKILGGGLISGFSNAIKWLGGLLSGGLNFGGLPFGNKGKANPGKGSFLSKLRMPKSKFGKAALLAGGIAAGSWVYNKFFGSDDKPTKEDDIEMNNGMAFQTDIKDSDINLTQEYNDVDYNKALKRYGNKIKVPDFEDEPNYNIKNDPKYIYELKNECAEWEAKARAMTENVKYYKDNKKSSLFYDKHVKTYYKGNLLKLADVKITAEELEKRINDAKDEFELQNANFNKLMGNELSQKDKNVLSGKLEGDYTSLPRKELDSLEKDIFVVAKCKASLEMAKNAYTEAEETGSRPVWTSTEYREYLSKFEAEYRSKWMKRGVTPPSHDERVNEALSFKKQEKIWEEKLRKLLKTGKSISEEEKSVIDNIKINEDIPKVKSTQIDLSDQNSFNMEDGEVQSAGSTALEVATTAATFFPGTAWKLAKGAFNKVKDFGSKAMNFIKNTSFAESASKATETVKNVSTVAESKGFWGNMWDKAKSVGSSIVDGAKKAGNFVVDKVAGAVPEKVKDIARKVVNVLKSFKDKAMKKLGKNAGLKLVARISAKIASRLVPGAGWALLLVDAGEIAWHMFKNGLKLAAAVSVVILGFNLLDDDSVALDEDGNPIKPDDSDPDPKSTQREYYKEVEKTKQTDKDRLEDIENQMSKQFDVSDDMRLSNNSFNIESQNKVNINDNKTYNSFAEELKRRRERKTNLAQNISSDYNNAYKKLPEDWSQIPEDDNSGEYVSDIDLDKDPSKAQLNNLDYIKSLFTFAGYNRAKFKRYNKLTPEEAFMNLNTDFKERLVGLARDYQALTGNKLQINSSFRTAAYQGVLQGAGPKASPGNSPHQYGIAADVQMGEKNGGAGLIGELGKLRGEALLRKWGLWRPLWDNGYRYKKGAEDWHVEPVWSSKVARNKDGWSSEIRRVGSGGIRSKYNVNDSNAVKAVALFKEGNLSKFNGGTKDKEPKLDNKVAGLGSVGNTNNVLAKNDSYISIEGNTGESIEINKSNPEIRPKETILNTEPPVIAKPSVTVSNQNEEIIAKNSNQATEAEIKEARNEKSEETIDKTLNINEEQLATQKQHLEATNKLIALLESQNENILKENARATLERSRIQNQPKSTGVISNSPEENIKNKDIETTTNRPGQAFNLTRRA